MKQIKIRDYLIIIDDEDFGRIYGFKLGVHKGNDETDAYPTVKIDGKVFQLNRYLLLGPTSKRDKRKIAHLNRNRCDVRRQNMRFYDKSFRICRRRNKSHTSSKFKGLTFNKQRWNVVLTHNGISEWKGAWRSEVYAARQYDKFAKELIGEYAVLNFKKPTKGDKTP